MPIRKITAEVDGKVRTITADIPDGASQIEIVDAVKNYLAEPTPKPSLLSQVMAPTKEVARNVGGLVTGVAKSVAEPVYGGAKALGIPLPDMTEYAEPTTDYEKAGKTIGSTAQFFLPGLGAEAATAKLGSMIPAIAKGAGRLATKSALEAGGMGALSKAHGASPGGVAFNTVLGAAGPFGELAARAIANKWPAAIVNNMLRPFAKQFRFGKNPGQGVVEEGIVARSMNSLWDQIQAAKQKVGGQIGGVLKSPKAQVAPAIDINAQLSAIDDALEAAGEAGPANKSIIDQLRMFRDSLINEYKYNPITGESELIGARGPMTPENAAGLKRTIGENTRWTGEAYDKPLNLAKSQTYGKLRGEVESRVPEVGPLNERYGNLLEAEKIAERRANANPNIRMTELAAGAAGESMMHGAGIPAALMTGGLRTAPGATGLAQLIRRGTVPVGQTLKDVVAAWIAQNTGRNSQPTGR